MRIAVGSIMQETNSFVPISTTLDTFRNYYLLYDDELFTGYNGAQVEVPAFLDVLRQAKATPVPLLAGFAAAGGPLTRSTFDQLLDDLLARLQSALPLDGVLLALHGAMTVEDDPDAEGTILEAVRSVVGTAMPIGVSLDLHGHITPRMVEHASFLIGYQEYPHIDIHETGLRTARLFLAMLAGERHPTTALAKRPMIVSPVNARTTAEPLQRICRAAREMEASGRAIACLALSGTTLDGRARSGFCRGGGQ